MDATAELDEGVDFGLSDTDFGAGIVTLVAALTQDTAGLEESAKVENVGLLVACARWIESEIAARVADIAADRGGPTDEVEAMERAVAEQAASDEGTLGPGWRSGREPRPRFWECVVLGARLGLSEGEARRLVSTSVALAGRLPDTAAALEAGDISWKHAEALAVQTAELSAAHAAAVELAVLSDRRATTAGQFRTRAKEAADRLRPPAEADPRLRTASARELLDGQVKLDAVLDPEGGRILARAVEAYATPTGTDDPRGVGERWADALVEIGRVALDHLDAGRAGAVTRGGRRPHVTLIADARTGSTELEGAGYLRSVPVDPTTAAWIGCTADVHLAVVDAVGRVVGTADADRRMPGAALRREVALRDRGCRWPGCTREVWRCEPHHVRFASDGGASVADNLLTLCEVHHEAVHRDGWRIAFDGVEAILTDPHGRRYVSPPPSPPPLAEPPDLTTPRGSPPRPRGRAPS